MNRFDWLICWKSPRKGGRPDTFANNIYYSKPDSSGSQATLSHECLLRLNVGVIKRKCRVKWLNKRKHIFDHHQHCISYMRLNDASFCVSFVWFKCGKIMNLLIGFPTTVSITSRLYKKKHFSQYDDVYLRPLMSSSAFFLTEHFGLYLL